jgi:hypothetical protein
MRVPPYLAGIYSKEAGVTKVKATIEAHMELSVK